MCLMQKLYGLGGRKFMVMSVCPIGCTPMAKAFRPMQMGCLEELNLVVQLLNFCSKSIVDLIRHELPVSTFVHANQYKIIKDIIEDAASGGMDSKEIRRACCDKSSLLAGGNRAACKKDGKVCRDRRKYVYFDGSHPMGAVSIHVADKTFASSNKDEAYPININQLAAT